MIYNIGTVQTILKDSDVMTAYEKFGSCAFVYCMNGVVFMSKTQPFYGYEESDWVLPKDAIRVGYPCNYVPPKLLALVDLDIISRISIQTREIAQIEGQ